MTAEPIQKQATHVLYLINIAVRNLRMYPADSPLIGNSIQKVHQAFESLLKEADPLIIGESERNLILCGEALNEIEQRRPQVGSFLDLMLDHGIRSLTFHGGVQSAEILDLADILKETPEAVKTAGGLKHLWEIRNPAHIQLDQKIYVVHDNRQALFTGKAVADGDLVKGLIGEQPLASRDVEGLRKRAQDPLWVRRVFQAGIEHIQEKNGRVSTDELSKALGYLILRLDSLVTEDVKDQLAKELHGPLEQIDEEILWRASKLDFPGKLGRAIQTAIKRLIDGKPLGRPASDSPFFSAVAATGEDGRVHRQPPNDAPAADAGRSDFSQAYRSPHFRHGFQSIIKGHALAFKDHRVTGLLPEVVSRLYKGNKRQEANFILDRLTRATCCQSPEIRAGASETLLRIGETLQTDDRHKDFDEFTPRLISWIKSEAEVTPTYRRICRLLRSRAISAIGQKQYSECVRIFDAFSQIANNEAPTHRATATYTDDLLGEMVDKKLTDQVAKDFREGEDKLSPDAGDCLVKMGPAATEQLFGILIESENIDERLRTIRCLSEIGPSLASIVAQRILKGGPWYYIRNLVIVLAKVGDPSHLECLLPLVFDNDRRVQREALYAIYRIGGESRGDTLLSFVSQGDNQLKMDTIELLGALKYRRAVPILVEMLTTRSLGWSKGNLELKEKICHALGRIGSPEAVPALIKLTGQKGFLPKSSQHDRLKAAAEKALVAIDSPSANR